MTADRRPPRTQAASPVGVLPPGPGSPCRFDDWLHNRFLTLSDPLQRIRVHSLAELPAAWEAIETARRAGHWVALLLDYELGEWLEPALRGRSSGAAAARPDTQPRLTAIVHARGEWHPAPVRPSVAGPHMAEGYAFTPHAGIPPARHARDVDAIRTGIARGDYYQVNYTMPLWLDWPEGLDPVRVYEDLASRHPVAHAACIRDADRWVLSLSPELFVARRGSRLRVRPMKGTAPRCATPQQDQESAARLLRSEKDRAENLMIVDLLRNDLGRIATAGSVRVSSLFDLEAYPSVWTLTSTIEAEAPDVPLAQVLHALFPCGSVTGAPKIAAMNAIRQLEQRRRGIYCGSIGWLAPDGDFSLNVAIRTIELRDGRAQFGVGGGIVHDSRAANEWEECLWKARILNPA